MLILLDMDGVIADLEAKLVERIVQDYPETVVVPNEERTTFYIEEDYPHISRQYTWDIMSEEGFYRNLPVMEGAQQGVKQLLADGHDIKICTSPVLSSFCIREKIDWIGEHFPELRKDIVTSNDKTIIMGDILIDDKEPITGYFKRPLWYHVPYASGKRNSGTFTWEKMDYLNNIMAQLERGAL